MLAFALSATLQCTTAVAAEPVQAGTTSAQREIAALIDAIGTSSCRFQRNGSWYDAAAASAHLRRKYDWLSERSLAGTAEQFIERGASRSSVSGKPYRVQCGSAATVDASVWFVQALKRLRAKNPSPATR